MTCEKDYYTPFSHWVVNKYKDHNPTTLFELKYIRGDKLREYDFKPHQLRALKMAKHNSIYFKPPDTSLTPSPCDVFFVKESRAYGVIFFANNPKKGFFIDIDTLLISFKTHTKGLTEPVCEAICTFSDII